MQLQDDFVGKVIGLTHVVAASLAALIAAAAESLNRQQNSRVSRDHKIIPDLHRTESGRVGKLEKFSHYVENEKGLQPWINLQGVLTSNSLQQLKYRQGILGLILISPLCKEPSWTEWFYNKVSNLLYFYGMCGVVKEILLKRYFRKEIRGGTQSPELDIVKTCRRVTRQMGFEDASEVPELCRLAHDYLRKTKGCEESIYEYLAKENDPDSLYRKLIDEYERCILSYFAFHWNQASDVISQVLSIESDQKIKLKNIVLAATRKQRFERVTKSLKVQRVFSTLVEEMKAIKLKGDSQCTDVMVPIAHGERSPVLLLMGGGMGAGKSTVLKDILEESFWSGASSKAVVVEADAFKESDVIYRALSSRGHHDDMLQTAELVHQSSTDAASSLLVTALNEGRDVIMDGTLSWEPFLMQTIAMARNVHKFRYRMGVGYKVAEDGTVTENYWEQVNEAEEEHHPEKNSNGETHNRKPYRIELVGVVCDGYLAVVRGIRRAIMTGRAVRVNSQLTSHKRFANAFPRYCKLVDNARLYCTNSVGGPPKLIGWKDGDHNLLLDPEDINCLERIGSLNAEADSIYELYKEPSSIMGPGSVWNDIILSPSRPSDQKELRESIHKIEKSIRKR